MGRYLDEMRRLTIDPACHRIGEIADQLSDRIAQCCGDEDDEPAGRLGTPEPGTEAAAGSSPPASRASRRRARQPTTDSQK